MTVDRGTTHRISPGIYSYWPHLCRFCSCCVSSKLALFGRLCHLTSAAEICDEAPSLSLTAKSACSFPREDYRSTKADLDQDQQRGLHMTGFEPFCQRRSRAPLQRFTALALHRAFRVSRAGQHLAARCGSTRLTSRFWGPRITPSDVAMAGADAVLWASGGLRLYVGRI